MFGGVMVRHGPQPHKIQQIFELFTSLKSIVCSWQGFLEKVSLADVSAFSCPVLNGANALRGVTADGEPLRKSPSIQPKGTNWQHFERRTRSHRGSSNNLRKTKAGPKEVFGSPFSAARETEGAFRAVRSEQREQNRGGPASDPHPKNIIDRRNFFWVTEPPKSGLSSLEQKFKMAHTIKGIFDVHFCICRKLLRTFIETGEATQRVYIWHDHISTGKLVAVAGSRKHPFLLVSNHKSSSAVYLGAKLKVLQETWKYIQLLLASETWKAFFKYDEEGDIYISQETLEPPVFIDCPLFLSKVPGFRNFDFLFQVIDKNLVFFSLVTLFPVFQYKNTPNQIQRRRAKPYVRALQAKFNAIYRTNISLTLRDCYRKTEFQVFSEQLAKLRGEYIPVYIYTEALPPRRLTQEQRPVPPLWDPTQTQHQALCRPHPKANEEGFGKAPEEGPPTPAVLTQHTSPTNNEASKDAQPGKLCSTPPQQAYPDQSPPHQDTVSLTPEESSGDPLFQEATNRSKAQTSLGSAPQAPVQALLTPTPELPNGIGTSQQAAGGATGRNSESVPYPAQENYEPGSDQPHKRGPSPTDRTVVTGDEAVTLPSPGDLPPTSTTRGEPTARRRKSSSKAQSTKKAVDAKNSKLAKLRRQCEQALGKPRRSQPKAEKASTCVSKYAVQPLLPEVRIPKRGPIPTPTELIKEVKPVAALRKAAPALRPAASKQKPADQIRRTKPAHHEAIKEPGLVVQVRRRGSRPKIISETDIFEGVTFDPPKKIVPTRVIKCEECQVKETPHFCPYCFKLRYPEF
ncbi:hypothetical protein QAD02_023286 [Eretmocerus hayati]|uniref:Uncharacterized protein n=1 Tax=Eretmocerus hayati TaxID=131215 RepID=A0ACC2PYS0_9HYME|nr:hypothetical protein QAD02_023286 [Eretmocerus hayati]